MSYEFMVSGVPLSVERLLSSFASEEEMEIRFHSS